MRRLRRRRGLGRIEVISLAIVAVLMLAVSVPALQAARQTARETGCRNNLKQLGLALHNYHDVYNMFAPGWVSREASGEGHPSTGWTTAILPFLGQARFYNELDGNCVYETPERLQKLLKSPVKAYRCPVDSLGMTNPLRGGWGTSNYTGNFGSNPIPRWSTQSFWPGQAATIQISTPLTKSSPAKPSLARRYSFSRTQNRYFNGIFCVNSNVRIRDITDGTSNTIMVGEKSVSGQGGIWPGPRSNLNESDVVADGSHASLIHFTENGYSSRHPGGIAFFLLCDGSSRSIHGSIDSQPEMGLLQKLSARNDGQLVGRF